MGRRRQLVLFLAVLILPAALIAVQGYRLSVQERELARSRADELRKRTAADIGQDLVTRLDRIRTQEMANMPATPTRRNRPADPAVVAVGWIDGDRLVWPWDVSPAASPAEGPDFLRAIDAGKRAEFVDLRADRAAELYGRALAIARHDAGRATAHLALARTQLRAGRRSAAATSYGTVLALPSSVVDEHGLSHWSSAAMPLVEVGAAGTVLTRLTADLTAPTWWPTLQMYRYRTMLEALQSSRDDDTQRRAGLLMAQVTARLTDLERAESLQRDFPRLPLSATAWRVYKGSGLWLVGRSPEGSTARPLVFAVRWEPIRQAIESERVARGGGPRFQIAADAPGDTLNAGLPDLRVAFPDGVVDQAAGLSPQRSLWGLSFAVVALLTCLSGYLFWRDVRREAHIAELRTHFVSSVSHELKTPLTSIRMFAELLQMRGGGDPQQARYLDTIVSESERLTRLLNNVLDFSRIERGQKTYRLEPAALPDVVQAAVRAIQYPLAQQGFALDLRVSESIPTVAVDRDALQQAILNLLTNAMKYSGSHREIGLRLAAENGTALIQVSDRGIGIPEHEHRRIFQKFYRVPTPENREIAGTGLGLSLVAHIAEAHGGRVHVHSRPGEGSTFSILLPLKAGDVA